MRPTKIFVGALSSRTRTSDLRELFQHYGRVTECDILSNFGFVHMENVEDARMAIRSLNGYKLDGVNITVVLSVSNGRTGGMGGDRNRFRRGRRSIRGPSFPSRSSVASRGDSYSSRYRPSSVSKYDSREYYPDPYDRRAPPSSSHRDMSPPSSRGREQMGASMRDRSPPSPPSRSSHREPYGTRRDEYGRLVATSREEERYAATGRSGMDARDYRSRMPTQYYDEMSSERDVMRSRHADYDYPSQSRDSRYYSREGGSQQYASSGSRSRSRSRSRSSSSSPDPRDRRRVTSRRDSSSSPARRRSSASPYRRRYASTGSSSSSSSSSASPSPPPRQQQRRQHHSKTKRQARRDSSESSSPRRSPPSSRESSESPPRRRHRGHPPSPPTEESSPSPEPEPKSRRRWPAPEVPAEVPVKKRRHHAPPVQDHGDYEESDSPKHTVPAPAPVSAPPPEPITTASDSASPRRRKKHKDRSKSRGSKKEKRQKKVSNGTPAT